MTNKEALIAVVRVSVPDNSLEKAMIDNDVTGATAYVKTAEESIDKCAIAILEGILSDPDITEGGYSINFDRKAVEDRLSILKGKYGLDDSLKPKVTSRSVW